MTMKSTKSLVSSQEAVEHVAKPFKQLSTNYQSTVPRKAFSSADRDTIYLSIPQYIIKLFEGRPVIIKSENNYIFRLYRLNNPYIINSQLANKYFYDFKNLKLIVRRYYYLKLKGIIT